LHGAITALSTFSVNHPIAFFCLEAEISTHLVVVRRRLWVMIRQILRLNCFSPWTARNPAPAYAIPLQRSASVGGGGKKPSYSSPGSEAHRAIYLSLGLSGVALWAGALRCS
jgi:hypothetical protein